MVAFKVSFEKKFMAEIRGAIINELESLASPEPVSDRQIRAAMHYLHDALSRRDRDFIDLKVRRTDDGSKVATIAMTDAFHDAVVEAASAGLSGSHPSL